MTPEHTTPVQLCMVCEALPGRDGYCHGCALDCIDGLRAALQDARREADERVAEAAAEARAATLREMDAPGVFTALRAWLAESEALRGPGRSPEFHEGKVLALRAVRGWLDEHVPDAAHVNPKAPLPPLWDGPIHRRHR